MKMILGLVIVFLAQVTVLGEFDKYAKTSYITSRYKSRIYESCITADHFDKMPSWDPMGQKPIPVSPGQAISLARSVLERHVPEAERPNWVLTRVELLHYNEVYPPRAYSEVHEQKWYYVVHFWNKTNPEVAAIPTPPAISAKQDEFNIFVLLSAEAINPVPRQDKRDSEQPSAGDSSTRGAGLGTPKK